MYVAGTDAFRRVFKPKDEEPYGRLNPKVRAVADFSHQIYLHCSSDYEVVASTTTVAHSIRSCLPDTESKVCCWTKALGTY